MTSVLPGHEPFLGGPEQRANLERLCAHVERSAKRTRFDMAEFDNRKLAPSDVAARRHPCGTTACFAGYGPSAGVAPLAGESWDSYSERAFLCEASWGVLANQWSWLFGYEWRGTAPTPADAVARARYLLAHGLPPNADAQMLGRAPLSFRADGAARATSDGASQVPGTSQNDSLTPPHPAGQVKP